ncbi:unnamed protein product [Mortierella alpina]
MFARSLLSLLAVATVALQTCAAISDGLYRISLSDDFRLAVWGPGNRDEPVKLLPDDDHTWKVQNHEDRTVTILHSKTGRYLAPKDPAKRKDGDQAIASDKKFLWRLKPAGEDREVIERADGDSDSLVLSQPIQRVSRRLVEVSQAVDGYQGQGWKFERVGDFREKTEAHCGPWRFPRESIHYQ